jgi:hypothetical protein
MGRQSVDWVSGDLIAEVFAAQGYWVARCPRPHCWGAEHHGPRRGGAGMELGGLFDAGMECKECHGRFAVTWPTDRAEIERILMDRPDPATRNWLPGETLQELVIENLAHGIIPPVITGQRFAEGGALTGSEMTSILFPGRSVLALEGGC